MAARMVAIAATFGNVARPKKNEAAVKFCRGVPLPVYCLSSRKPIFSKRHRAADERFARRTRPRRAITCMSQQDTAKHLERARKHLEKNKLQDALAEYQAVLQESPNHPEAVQMLSDIYVRM